MATRDIGHGILERRAPTMPLTGRSSWGPNAAISFNKLDVLPPSRLAPTAGKPHQPDAHEIQKVPGYTTLTDGEWSSENGRSTGSGSRTDSEDVVSMFFHAAPPT